MTPNTVMVPLDGSRLAETALPVAINLLGDRPEAILILMRAARATVLPCVDPVEAQVAVVGEAVSYLEALADRIRENRLAPLVTTTVWYGSAAGAIVEAAETRHADVIVMSTHGRSGLVRMLAGSVAESVLRSTRTPVLLVPARGTHLGVPAVREIDAVAA